MGLVAIFLTEKLLKKGRSKGVFVSCKDNSNSFYETANTCKTLSAGIDIIWNFRTTFALI